MKKRKRILLVDDETSFRVHLGRLFTRKGYDVTEAATGGEALALLGKMHFDVVLLDIVLPDKDGVEILRDLKEQTQDIQVIMMTANATVSNAISSMKLGAYDYLIKPFEVEELTILIERACELSTLRRESKHLRHELARQREFDEFVGKDPEVLEMLELVAKVAPTDSTVLITGETGTGKELIAKAIHRKSARRDKPFIVVNCSAIQETLLESEMYGYEKGAFTGATRNKSGLIEVANTGTLFLDEIGELSHTLQVKLLRFLEGGEYRRVGSARSLRADVRLLAATNRNLKRLIQDAAFRDDLFYRLNVINIQLPPLRERKADIEELVQYFLRKTCSRMGKCIKRIDANALEMLCHYQWPGNVRELENVIERAVILTTSEMITTNDFPADLVAPVAASPRWQAESDSLADVEHRQILKVLQNTVGNKTRAAAVLGITKKTLYAKLRAYGIFPRSQAARDPLNGG